MTYDLEFLPSKDLAKEYLLILENKLREKSSEREICEMRKLEEGFAECRGEKPLSHSEHMEFLQNVLGHNFYGTVVDYTMEISERSEETSGLVVKLTENNSFNGEFLEIFKEDDDIGESYPEFFSNLHGEFRDYLKENSMKLVYSKVRVNEKDEIEFYDFVKKDFPSIDDFPEDNWVSSK